MQKIKMFSVFVVVLLSATLLSAQATRTWVSGVGDDANPCSRTAPCKTWAGAIAKTAPGGEIDSLDPGGFGALTITKSITLDGGGGQVGSVLVAGTNGITVAAGATDVVIIRNIRFDGLLGNGSNSGNAGLTGISFLSGKSLVIENAFITGFNTSGISASLSATATLTITNTIIENIGTCVPASCTAGQGDGIYATTSSGTVKVEVNNSTVTAFSNNGVEAGAHSIVGFDNGAITSGANGVTADATGTAIVSHSAIAYNTGNGYNGAGGTVAAYARGTATAANGTNRVHDNGATGTVTYITEN
jgi:hypothetical protein